MNSLEQNFKIFKEKYSEETLHLSNVSTMSMNVNYQRIIGMGDIAVHFMLKDLVDNGPFHWFWALNVITGENPIKEEIAGCISKMTDVWIEWGENNGYLPEYTKNAISTFEVSKWLNTNKEKVVILDCNKPVNILQLEECIYCNNDDIILFKSGKLPNK